LILIIAIDQTRQEISPGKVCYITTGAPVPWGADAVVMVEDTEKLSEVRVRINKASKSRWARNEPSAALS